MLSQEFLYRLEDEINRARYEIDEQYHMGDYGFRSLLRPSPRPKATQGPIDVDVSINLQKIDEFTVNTRVTVTAISRLREKLSKASGVAVRAAAALEAEADALIAEEGAIKAETTAAFAPHKEILSEVSAELQSVKDALKIMSNGGPTE